MAELERGVGVALFVLRPTEDHDTELLLESAGETDRERTWQPLLEPIEPDAREAPAALALLASRTGLEPERLYAQPVAVSLPESPERGAGRIGLFVARVGPGAGDRLPEAGGPFAWVRVREAATWCGDGPWQAPLDRLLQDFVRQAPDEALRIL